MALLNEQIKDRIKSPKYAVRLSEAVRHERRVKLHTKAVDDKSKAKGFSDFIRWVKEGILLPEDKLKAFEGMCRFPLPTNALCSSIFDNYQKIFETRDAFFDVSMSQDTMKAEFMQYVKDTGIFEWFKTDGFEAYKKQFNCVFVVDMPALQLTPRPEPYFYKVPICEVIDMDVEDDGTIEYVIFKGENDQVIAIDELRYSVWQKDAGGEYMLFLEAPHILEYCPATFFAQGALYDDEDDNHIARKIPASESLGDLDWLLFYNIAQRMYETYGPFPILTIPEQRCDFTDAYQNVCQNGMITGTMPDGKPYERHCPACAKSSIVGPGSIFSRPIRTSKDQPELGNAVDITPAEVDSLDYITKKVDYLEWEIYSNCTGSREEQIIKQAINQDQVVSSHEGERAMLLRVKRDFEAAVSFIINTMGKLMYGDYYEGCTYTMGDQFMLESRQEILDTFIGWKKAGLPIFLVSGKKEALIQSEYKNNSNEINRAELLNQLEPWPDMSLGECLTYQLNLQYPEKFLLKLDFAKFVRKFERANGDILFWGSALSQDEKVNRITQILQDYASQEQRSAKQLPAGTGVPGSAN